MLYVWHADQYQPVACAALACAYDTPTNIKGMAFEYGGRLADPDWLPEHGVRLAACSAREVPHRQPSLSVLGALWTLSPAFELRRLKRDDPATHSTIGAA